MNTKIQTLKLFPAKISLHTWAGLQTGRISHLTEFGVGSPTLRFKDGFFVMTRNVADRQEMHTLAAEHTDEVRLNKHWQGFVMEARS